MLRAAVAAPVVGVCAPLLDATAATAATAPALTPVKAPGRFDTHSPRFAIAVLPDTQYLFDADCSDPRPLRETFRYLVDERATDNIAFMTHLGDVTEHGSADEIGRAADAFRVIDAGTVPYSVLAGNHDVASNTDDQRGTTLETRQGHGQHHAG